MNIATVSLRYRVVVTVLTVLMIFVGIKSYQTLGRLEDPAFAIKQAVVVTSYPGAMPQEVADEVTEPIEAAIQQLSYVDYLSSTSTAGRSMVKVYIKDRYRGHQLPQIWDELRRKVSAAAVQLPPGAGTPMVDDDFGDVFGVLFYIYGDGFSMTELHEYARELRKELLLVKDVASVRLIGEPRAMIFLDVLPERLAGLGADLQAVVRALEGKGLVVPSAPAMAGDRRIMIEPTGGLDSLQAIGDVMVPTQSGALLRLGDVVTVSRGEADPPSVVLRYNDYRAIAIGVSTVSGGNVVNMGEAVQKRLQELTEQTPVGIEMGVVSMQSEGVRQAVRGFTIGLVESVVIVVGVLLLAMGLRAGVLIGVVLLLTILGTFVVMKLLGLELQRISLGALIIALGMLVDNAIVVVEGMIAGVKQGLTRAQAAEKIVGQTTWPLLGATVIAVLAFAPIGLSPDSTGDYCGSLFTVIWVSLLLSWVFAITSTPVIGAVILSQGTGDSGGDPYGGWLFRSFRGLLETILHHRWIALVVLIIMLWGTAVGFGKAKQGFFPNSARPQFMVELWQPQGTSIHAMDRELSSMTDWVREQEGVTAVAANAGSGTLRFELTYSPESPNPSYGQLMISVSDAGYIDPLMQKIRQRLAEHHPDVLGWPWRMVLGPGADAKIQVRLRGPDASELRRLQSQVQAIMTDDPYVTNLRSDWRQRVPMIEPVLDADRAARLGVTRREVSRAIALAYEGVNVGVYREGEDLIPLRMRSVVSDSLDAGALPDVLVPTAKGRLVSLQQVATQVQVGWQDPIIMRRDRVPTLTVMSDPAVGGAAFVLNRLRAQIEAIPLPTGYTMTWGGEYEKTSKASGGLMSLLPVCFGGMVLILIALFNNLRQPMVILMTLPLAIIGVTVGLLTTGAEFGFMPILGVLSLSGMMIKNAIVLIDEANALQAGGMTQYQAIVQSAVSRTRPVSMAAVTTVLGMIPLLTDVFFKDMAIVIMFGLSFATVLTLVAVPLLYVIAYRAYPGSKM